MEKQLASDNPKPNLTDEEKGAFPTVPSEHELKCWMEPFDATWRGDKRHEVRVNDRDYKVGDSLSLRQFDEAAQAYTGYEITAIVTYISEGGTWGLPPTLCVMSIRVTYRDLRAARVGAIK